VIEDTKMESDIPTRPGVSVDLEMIRETRSCTGRAAVCRCSVVQARVEEPQVMPARSLAVMKLNVNEHSAQGGNANDEDDKRAKSCFHRRMQELGHCLDKQIGNQPPECEQDYGAEGCGQGYIHVMTSHGCTHGTATCGCCIGIPSDYFGKKTSAMWRESQ